MNIVTLVLLILAALCFAWAALATTQPRVGLVPLGLLFWLLTVLIPRLANLD